MSYTQLGLYIDGKWNHGNGGGGEDVINPATQKPLAHLPHATAAASSRRPPTFCASAPMTSLAR